MIAILWNLWVSCVTQCIGNFCFFQRYSIKILHFLFSKCIDLIILVYLISVYLEKDLLKSPTKNADVFIFPVTPLVVLYIWKQFP